MAATLTTAPVPAPLRVPTSKRVIRDDGKTKASLGDVTPNNVGTLRKLNSVLFPVAYSDKFYKDVLDPRVADFCKLVYYNDLPVGAVCCRIEGGAASDGSKQPEPAKLYIMTLGVLAPYRRLGLASLLLSHVLAAAGRTHVAPPASKSLGADIAPPSTTNTSPAAAAAAASATKAPKLAGKEKKLAKAAAAAAEKENKASSGATGAAGKEKEGAKKAAEPVPPLAAAYVHVQHGNDDARGFYEARGFAVTGEVAVYYRKVEPSGCWVLGKDVVAPTKEELP